MMLRCLVLLLSLALLAAGCGSEEESAPRAATAEEWAGHVVNRLLRPTNRDIEVLSTLNNPQTKLFILQGNETTLEVIRERMGDLGKCSDRLDAIGPPPEGIARIGQLRRVDDALQRACEHYVSVSETVLDAVKLMSSGRADVIQRGEDKLREAAREAGAGAKAYDEAFKIALKIPEFQLHGVKAPT